MRLGLWSGLVVTAGLIACDDGDGGQRFGPPDAPRAVTLKQRSGPTADAGAPAAARAPSAGGAPSPRPGPVVAAAAADPTGPKTRADVRALISQWRHDPYCGTGDPWLNFTGRVHPSELLDLLSTWAMETTAEDRRVAVAALVEQTSPTLLPMWRALAQEPEGTFAREAIDGLLRCGDDGEVPLVLATLARRPELALVASLEKSPSARSLQNHLSLWSGLHQTTHVRGRLENRLEVPPAGAYPRILAAEARFVGCLGPTRRGSFLIKMRVKADGLPTNVEVSEYRQEMASADAEPCVKSVASGLVFPRPVPVEDRLELLGRRTPEREPPTAALLFTVSGDGVR